MLHVVACLYYTVPVESSNAALDLTSYWALIPWKWVVKISASSVVHCFVMSLNIQLQIVNQLVAVVEECKEMHQNFKLPCTQKFGRKFTVRDGERMRKSIRTELPLNCQNLWRGPISSKENAHTHRHTHVFNKILFEWTVGDCLGNRNFLFCYKK